MNRYIKKGLLFLVVFANIISCNRVKTTAEVKESYADGTPKKVEEYITNDNGEKILYKETHYFSGEKKYISGTYNNSRQRNGVWTSWYENGKKNSEQNYINGQEDGEYNVWHPNGKQYIKGKYKMGQEIGVWSFYDTLGKVMKEINFEGE
jgi:antitoxin component YwqK of YwqJK toxin-antitoxin module